jgi:8-oxo-dGTP pyrophosphatase MutT (NUDIX family)
MARGGSQEIPRPDGWRYGAANPWTGRAESRHFTIGHIEGVLARLSNGGLSSETLPTTPMRPPFMSTTRNAAVLAPLYVDDEGHTRVILTRRSARLRNHAGQVAFPGGRLDDGESDVDAALRETEEEIGLPRERVRVIGQLERLTTIVSSSSIQPFVGVVEGPLPTLTRAPIEVERVFDVRLADLVHADCYHEEIWAYSDGTFPVWFFDVDDDTIWGATARMLRRLLDLAILTDPPQHADLL